LIEVRGGGLTLGRAVRRFVTLYAEIGAFWGILGHFGVLIRVVGGKGVARAWGGGVGGRKRCGGRELDCLGVRRGRGKGAQKGP
jgi:hypothetical protein